MKTREQLEKEGILLWGPVIPEWFKPISDGCSVPKGLKWIMRARQGVAACRIHDYAYFCISFAYPPGHYRREELRIASDYMLKVNRAKSLPRILSRLYGALYFRGVRIGGSKTLKNKARLQELLSKTKGFVQEDFISFLRTEYPEIDQDWVLSVLNQ